MEEPQGLQRPLDVWFRITPLSYITLSQYSHGSRKIKLEHFMCILVTSGHEQA